MTPPSPVSRLLAARAWRARSHRPGDGERGAVTVELVLVAVPVLVAFLLAALAVGRLASARTALGGVTRDAARIAVTADTPAQAARLATQQAHRTAGGYRMDPTQLTLTTNSDGLARGGTLVVTATYRLEFLPGLGLPLTGVTLTDQHAELIDPNRSR